MNISPDFLRMHGKMNKFLVKEIFSFNECLFSQLFEEATYAWEPLSFLDNFFEAVELGKKESPILDGVHLVHPELITIGANVIIEPGAFIRGPCILGDGCEVRHCAYLRGHVVAGKHCVLGHSSEFKRVILLDDVCAAHFNYVGDSILGNGVNLGAGVKLANLRLDNEDVQVFDRGKKFSTNLKKLGAIIGDGAKIGCNSVTNPGTVIGKGAFCYPNLTIGGYVRPKAIMKPTQKVESHVNGNGI